MSKRLSRRDFLKNAVLGAAGVAAMGVGVSAKAEEAAIYVPDTYTATAQGYAGDVTVTMTFSESAITDVVINAAGETAGIGDKVAAEMPALILEHQSVDVATSATGAYTRSAVQKAAQECIDQALVVKPNAKPGLTFEPNEFGNPLWLTPELGMFDWRKKPEEPTEFTATEAADVIVVGAGLSGLCAARRSLELGDSVILLETDAKYDVHGFQCAALNPDLLRRECERLGLNYEDYKVDETEFVRNYMTTHGNRCNIDIVRLWAQQSGKAFDWLEEIMPEKGEDGTTITAACSTSRARRAMTSSRRTTSTRPTWARWTSPTSPGRRWATTSTRRFWNWAASSALASAATCSPARRTAR